MFWVFEKDWENNFCLVKISPTLNHAVGLATTLQARNNVSSYAVVSWKKENSENKCVLTTSPIWDV